MPSINASHLVKFNVMNAEAVCRCSGTLILIMTVQRKLTTLNQYSM